MRPTNYPHYYQQQKYNQFNNANNMASSNYNQYYSFSKDEQFFQNYPNHNTFSHKLSNFPPNYQKSLSINSGKFSKNIIKLDIKRKWKLLNVIKFN